MKASAETIINRIKHDLMEGQRVSSASALYKYGTIDMRKCLSILRKRDGMPISYEWIESATTGKRYKVHYMTPKQVGQYLKSL